MQDRYTKLVELRSFSTATSAAVAKPLKEQVIFCFGTTRAVVSDNGRQFIGKEFTQVLEDYKIKHRRTPPYTPQWSDKLGTEDCDKLVSGESPKEMRPVSRGTHIFL